MEKVDYDKTTIEEFIIEKWYSFQFSVILRNVNYDMRYHIE